MLKSNLKQRGCILRISYKQNKSDGKSEELYDFSHMWDVKLKAIKEKHKQEQINKKEQKLRQ